MTKNFLGNLSRRWVILIVTAAIAIWVVGGSLWYARVYMNKERRFWTAIENGLKTTSVTKEVINESPSGSQLQQNRFRLGADFSNQGRTLVTQKAAGGSSSAVATSTIATREGTFVRYDKIETTEKNQLGQDFDFSDVVGLWAAQDNVSSTPDGKAQSLAETFIQLVPFGNLSADDRKQIIQEMKDKAVYKVDFNAASDNDETGFTVYNVTLSTRAYVEILKEVFARQGLPTLAALDPEQYDKAASIGMQMSIDSSNAVRRININGSEQYEAYGGYGITENVAAPVGALSADELNSRLREAQ